MFYLLRNAMLLTLFPTLTATTEFTTTERS